MPLDYLHRIQLARIGLLTEAETRDLIIEAISQNKVAYLPREIARYGQDLIKRGVIKAPES
jgi:hypothetical protein